MLRVAVHQYIDGRGRSGATEQEVEGALGLAGNTVRPRLWELEGHGHARQIIKSIRKRPTRSGRLAHVYISLRHITSADTETGV